MRRNADDPQEENQQSKSSSSTTACSHSFISLHCTNQVLESTYLVVIQERKEEGGESTGTFSSEAAKEKHKTETVLHSVKWRTGVLVTSRNGSLKKKKQ